MTAVDAGSIAAAASVLHLAQPGLSRQLSELEYLLGQKLLRRLSSGVQPTEQGQVLYLLAKRVLQDVNEIAMKLEAGADAPAGKVTLGCTLKAAHLLGYPLYQAVKAALPNVSLVFVSGSTRELYRRLSSGDLDAAFMSAPRLGTALTGEPFVSDQVFVVGHHRLLGDSDAPLTISEAASLPLIVPSEGSFSIRDQLIGAAVADSADLNVVAEVDDLHLQRALLLAGTGCSLATWSLFRDEIETGRLRHRPLGNPPVERRIDLCLNVHRPLTIATEAVLKAARETVARMISEGSWKYAKVLDEAEEGSSALLQLNSR